MYGTVCGYVAALGCLGAGEETHAEDREEVGGRRTFEEEDLVVYPCSSVRSYLSSGVLDQIVARYRMRGQCRCPISH